MQLVPHYSAASSLTMAPWHGPERRKQSLQYAVTEKCASCTRKIQLILFAKRKKHRHTLTHCNKTRPDLHKLCQRKRHVTKQKSSTYTNETSNIMLPSTGTHHCHHLQRLLIKNFKPRNNLVRLIQPIEINIIQE